MIPSTAAARYRVALGVLLGLVASAALLSVFDGFGGGNSAATLRGPLLSDCEGPLRELAIHYVSEAAEVVGPTYGDFLRQLPAEVTVHVVCPDRAAFEELRNRVGAVQCVLSPVVVGHPITVWSRDRWLALAPAKEGDVTTLLCPRGELGTEVWPARAGDQRVGADLAAALGPNVTSLRSDLYFEGGDFVADGQTVFVTPAVLLRNLQQTVQTREELLERLSAVLKRHVVLLHDAPDHHAGMYMMAVGNGTVLVGDPAAAKRLLAESSDEDLADLCPKQGPDFTETTLGKFDAVAEQCRAVGYRVIRIPVVPGRDGRTYVTYLNAILDQRGGRRVVYMPVYSQAEVLNRAAAEVWSRLGYEVRTVNCDACYPHFGSLHCLVNVVRRD
jgi:N-dimethylarginine dimethylaminohydrolase